jgi:predicted negative regulator of RcsB-dependent stress response
VLRLVILIGVLGVGGVVGYHWWQSRVDSPNGGYHGAAARHYQRAYRICLRTVKRHSGKAAGHALRLVRFSARFRAAEIAGCTAGMRKAGGVGGLIDQLQQNGVP